MNPLQPCIPSRDDDHADAADGDYDGDDDHGDDGDDHENDDADNITSARVLQLLSPLLSWPHHIAA